MTLPLFVLLVAAAAAVLLCCGVLLFYHREYHAGAVGFAGLGMIALAALSRIVHLAEAGAHAWVSPASVLLWVGLALFLGRHVVKFVFRHARRGPTWYPRV
jgi:hypothetical protein